MEDRVYNVTTNLYQDSLLSKINLYNKVPRFLLSISCYMKDIIDIYNVVIFIGLYVFIIYKLILFYYFQTGDDKNKHWKTRPTFNVNLTETPLTLLFL